MRLVSGYSTWYFWLSTTDLESWFFSGKDVWLSGRRTSLIVTRASAAVASDGLPLGNVCHWGFLHHGSVWSNKVIAMKKEPLNKGQLMERAKNLDSADDAAHALYTHTYIFFFVYTYIHIHIYIYIYLSKK